MGIYSIQGINESSVSSYLEDIQIEDIVEENYMEAALRHTYEINENMHNVMKAIGIAELAVYEESGHDLEYVEESASGIFNKIKEMLKKVWEKIASLFKKFLAKVESYGKDDAAFVKKYRNQIVTGSVKGLKVKGYNFTLDNLSVADKLSGENGLTANGILSAMRSVESEISASNITINTQSGEVEFNCPEEKIDDIMRKYNAIDNNDVMEKMRGKALGDNKEYNQKEFNTALFELFRNNESSKEELDEADIKPTEMCDFLLQVKGDKKDIEKDYKAIYDKMKEEIKNIDNWNKERSKYNSDKKDDVIKSDNKKVAILTKIGNLLVQSRTMCEQMEAAKMNAYNDCRRQYKAICVKLIGRKEKNESAYYDDDLSYTNESSVNSFLDNVKLI